MTSKIRARSSGETYTGAVHDQPCISGAIELVLTSDRDERRRVEALEKALRHWGPEVDANPPTWLREAVEMVLADLQQPRPIALEVSYGCGQRGEASWSVYLHEPGELGSAVFSVAPEDRGPLLLVAFADYVQEQFFPETRSAWGEATRVSWPHASSSANDRRADSDRLLDVPA